MVACILSKPGEAFLRLLLIVDVSSSSVMGRLYTRDCASGVSKENCCVFSVEILCARKEGS